VIPEFYARDKSGIPTAWVKRMRESMAQLTPRFSADRTVREYTEERYLPAAARYLERAANKATAGKPMIDWQHAVDQKWNSLRFGAWRVETKADQHVFEVELFVNDLDPKAIRVELYADGKSGADAVRVVMKSAPLDSSHRCVYHATVPATRAAQDYTARVIPDRDGVSIPLEDARILWQR